MKLFTKIFSLMSLLTILLVVSCGSNVKIDIEGKMTITTYKTSITVATSFTDSEDQVIANAKVKCYVAVINSEDKELNRKNVTIDVETLNGGSLDFSGLDADSDYTVKLVASLDGSQKTLQTQSIKTLNNGESEEDPIFVSNKAELKAMNKETDAYYKLTSDIDLENESLSAIFNSSNSFSGHLDGAGFAIKNVKLDVDSTYTGIFGYMKDAEVKNLKIENASFDAQRGERYLAALAGYAENCKFENITIDGIAIQYIGQTSKTAYIGGFVGYTKNCTINNVTVNNLSINSTKARFKIHAGGLVGLNENSAISNSSVEGSITLSVGYTVNKNGFLYAGGFIGLNESAKGINNSYAKVDIVVGEIDNSTGKKTHTTYVGGFIGGNSHTIAKINDCAAIGDITLNNYIGSKVYVGGFFGWLNYSSVLTNCVYKAKENGIKLGFVDLESENTTLDYTRTISISLVGTYANKVSLNNTFAYTNELTYTGTEGITVVDAVVSQDLTQFNEVIKNLFN